MTTTVAEKSARSARVPTPEETTPGADGINRREFLYYIWGASMVMLMGGTGVGLIWYLLPRFREGEFGGDFKVSPSLLPDLNNPPADNAQGRFWFSNTDNGVAALYKVCTHLGCLFKWVDTNNRFECPCHGSKFLGNGLYVEGPAPRSLDRFEVTAVLNDDSLVESDELGLLHLDDPADVKEYIVHTGRKVQGLPAGQEYA